MAEKTLPWWRRALSLALSGIRAGLGLLTRAGRPNGAGAENGFSEAEAEGPTEAAETELTEQRIQPEPIAAPEPEAVRPAEALAEPMPEAVPRVEETPVEPVEEPVEAEPEPAPIAPRAVKPEAESAVEPSAAPIQEAAAEPADVAAEEPAEFEDEAAPEQAAAAACVDREPVLEAAPEPMVELEPAPAPGAEPVAVVAEELIAAPAEEPAEDVRQEPEAEAAPEAVAAVVREPEPEDTLEPTFPPEPEIASEPAAAPDAEIRQEPADALAGEPLEAEPEGQPVADDADRAQEMEPAPASVAEPVGDVTAGPVAALAEVRMEGEAAIAPGAESSAPVPSAPAVDEKAAARLAAQKRKIAEADEQSPFSVVVGQVYEGPLDLLLDLIRKQDLDIYDIPIAKITAQFLAYVDQLKASDVDVAGEFIYTASLLIHIKSRMLLPRAPIGPEETAEDPRRELVERLLEHERFKNAAQMLQQKQLLEAASWTHAGGQEFKEDESAEPEIAADTVDLVRVFHEILERARKRPVIDLTEDQVTVGQMIQFLARRLTMEDKPIALRRLLSHTRSERALIAMFLALLELVRLQAILLRQDRQFSEIFIKKHAGFETAMNEGLANARDDWR